MTSNLRKYLEHEKGEVERFLRHPFFGQMGSIPESKLKRYLLQRLHTSREFISWYNTAASRLHDEQAKEVLRGIMRDEIPQEGKTHFELLVGELMSIGITHLAIHTSEPTRETMDTIGTFGRLIRFDPEDRLQDLRILVGLRIAGEVLVSEEYRAILGILHKREMFTTQESIFYRPHCEHDDGESGNHAQAFLGALARLIYDDVSLAYANSVAVQATDARLLFFSQDFNGH